MKTVLRSLFVWLLLLALPFQGMAAARMLPSVGAAAGTVTAPVHAAPAHATPVHAAPSAHPCHGMPATATATHTVATDAGADVHAGGHADGKHHGPCADCCIAVAPVPARIVPPAFAPPSIAIPFHAGHVPSVDPTLPERPPRLSAA